MLDLIKPPSAFDLKLMEDGNEVGELVQQLYPQGQSINLTKLEERVNHTKRLMGKETEVIFEATFFFDGIEVRIDVLIKTKEGYEIREIKSSTTGNTNDSKKKKEMELFIHDVSIQYYVLNALGIQISKSFVVLLDNTYTRNNALDVKALFEAIDVSQRVLDRQDSIPEKIHALKQVISDNKVEPDVDIGAHCHINGKKCPAKEYCWQIQRNIPAYSVFEIFTLGNKSLALYADGIVKIEDIPDDYKLTAIQKFRIKHWKNKTGFVNPEEIRKFISNLRFPLFHLDFETFNPAIPQYSDNRPYQHIPFQYSLHIEDKNGLKHKEFLGNPRIDPREELICRLLSDIKGNSSVIVYSNYESRIIKELAKDFPEYMDELLSIHERIIDFAKIFQYRHFYSYKLKNKFSIKEVMPLCVPNMKDKYRDLKENGKVSNGEEAMMAFKKLLIENDSAKIEKIRRELLDYCELDTLSTVETLRAIAEKYYSDSHTVRQMQFK
jgi:hypothetical protein